jgi:hypothetical protein
MNPTPHRAEGDTPIVASPERRMVAAFIERNLRDAVSVASPIPNGSCGKQSDINYREALAASIRLEASEWILGDDDGPWTLRWCIDMLGWGERYITQMRGFLDGERRHWDGRVMESYNRRKVA